MSDGSPLRVGIGGPVGSGKTALTPGAKDDYILTFHRENCFWI